MDTTNGNEGVRFSRRTAMTAVGALGLGWGAGTTPAAAALRPGASAATNDTIVVRWNMMGLEAARRSTMGAPVIARAMAMLHTAIYDAWTAYDPVAVGTRLGRQMRRPVSERTARNKNAAISYAAYDAVMDLWPEAKPTFDAFMRDLGYPPDRRTTVAGSTGIAVCRALQEYRHSDGANQEGDRHPGPYSDYTGYGPANRPMVVARPLDPTTVSDPNYWQPLVYPSRSGKTITQEYLGPHWGLVKPFALSSWDEFKPSATPPRYGTDAYVERALELIDRAAGLDDRQKAIAEYWADGAGTPQPPGHWSAIGQYVSRRDGNTVDQDVKLFFVLTNALFDASIAAWGLKRDSDYVRPITAIRYLFHGKQIRSWSRAGKGPKLIDGAMWKPYQPTWFPTPPFAEYVSGHSAFSAAGAEILKRFTGSDYYGGSEVIPAGSSDVEPGVSPQAAVTLSWKTFSDASDEAGISRRYGGIHFRDGDLNARVMGRKVAAKAWDKAQAYFSGDISPE